MDIFATWTKLVNMTNQEVMDWLQSLFPTFDLFSLSLDWRTNPEYILKAKGVRGDVLVLWERDDRGFVL